MAIKITDDDDVHVSSSELVKYRNEYNSFMRYFAGPFMTLEEYIR